MTLSSRIIISALVSLAGLALSLSGGAATVGDFDGDGKTDKAVWRPSTGTWYIIPSSAPTTFTATQWGVNGDIPVPGDYDGDGKTDKAVWRPSTGTWYIIPTSAPTTFIATQWGVSGDIPVPGDYDGDGKTDIAVWRPSTGTWYILPSSKPGTFIAVQWGMSGDIPVSGDYDGDGKADMAVWRPSTGTWYIIPSNAPTTFTATQWGVSGDIPVPGDYDGDGKTDKAVWRPSNGTWYVIPTSAPTTFTATQWGVSGDIPVPGDYDGDGKTDKAVWRPSNGTWYIIPTSAPTTFTATQWGVSTDVPADSVSIVPSGCDALGSESLLSGGYAFLLKGFDSSSEPALVGGVLTFNGSGTISAGAIDMNLNSGVQSLTVTSGTYGIGSDRRGCMAITTSAGTQHYAFSVGNISGTPAVASTAHVIDFDAAGPFTTGTMLKQSGGSFSTASVSGTYAFGASSIQNTAAAVGGGKFGIAGLITFNGSGGITSGSEDINQNGTLDGSAANTSWPATSPITFGAASTYSISSNGRGTLTIAIDINGVAATTSHAFLYGVSSSHSLFMTSDAQTATQIVGGEALLQSGTPFATDPLSGTYVGYDLGLGGVPAATTDRADLLLIGPLTSGSTALTGTQYRNDGGTFTTQSLAGGTYNTSSAGRMIIFGGGHTPVLYLVNTTQAFLLTGNGSVDSGFVQSQTGTSASGAYAFGLIDPEVANVGATSGVVTLSSGNATATTDNNSSGGPQPDQTNTPTTYSIDANGLGHIPASCTPGTNCQLIFLVVSPARFILTQLQHNNGTAQANPGIAPVDQ